MSVTLNSTGYRYACSTTIPSPSILALLPVLTPTMGEVDLFFPSFNLGVITTEHLQLPIYHQIHARNYSTSREEMLLGQVKGI